MRFKVKGSRKKVTISRLEQKYDTLGTAVHHWYLWEKIYAERNDEVNRKRAHSKVMYYGRKLDNTIKQLQKRGQ